jgi:hypothetical protein
MSKEGVERLIVITRVTWRLRALGLEGDHSYLEG